MKERIFRPDAELEVYADETCLAGQTIQVEVVVCPQEQLTPREVRLELVGEETYYVENKLDDDSHLDKKVKAFTSVSYTVMEHPCLYPGIEARSKVTVQIPANAPPTCCGKIVDVHWKLKAVLDIPGGRDRVHELPVLVMSDNNSAREAMKNTLSDSSTDSFLGSVRKKMHEAYLGYRSQSMDIKDIKKGLSGEKGYKNCILRLEVPELMEAWGAVSGTLQVKALSKFKLRGIRVELVRVEHAHDKWASEVVALQDLSGPVSFKATESSSFTFSLPLQSVGAPTMMSPNSSLRWQVRAVLDRKMRKDFNIQRDLIICNVAL